MLDKKDKRIITELDMNARMPLTELAKKVGVSRQVIEYRIKRLKKENIIFGAKTVFDSAVIGQNWYRVVLRLVNINQSEKNTFIDYLKQHQNTLWVGEIGGNWDIIVNFICEDNFNFNRIFEEISSKFGKHIMNYEILIYINVTDLERNYILDRKEKQRFTHEMQHNKSFKIDNLDHSIIKIISRNAFKKNLEIANKLKVSSHTIKNRINRMIKNKFILGFRLFINPTKLNYKPHMLFLGINKLNSERENLLIENLKTTPNITFVVKHMGRWRLGVEIEARSEQEFQEIFVDIRGKFSDIITDYETFPIFKDHAINYFPTI
jgi:Lrp/AsnC family transcriptional regulator, leucine-responsive regulatory protein